MKSVTGRRDGDHRRAGCTRPGRVKKPIYAMMNEHDSAGDLVKQIRKASGDYAPPADACTSYKALYQDLREFEADLHQHVHLENNILFPRAVEMEAAVV